MKPLSFSFVVPACNVALYAADTIRSLKNQTYPDFEAIIVNEESRDDTNRVLREAIDGDCRFQVIELPRSGSASVSRNYGIEHATGDYLIFIDGDDWIEPDTLTRFAPLLRDMPDIVAAEYRNWRENPDGTLSRSGGEHPYNGVGQTLPGAQALTRFMRNGTDVTATWRYWYRREFLVASGCRQIPGRRHQDDEWTPRVLFAARSVLISGECYYNYRKRPHSVTTTPSPASLRDIADNIHSALEFCHQNHFPFRLARLTVQRQCYLIRNFFSPKQCNRYPGTLRRECLNRALTCQTYRTLFCFAGVRDWLFALCYFPAWFFDSDRLFRLAERCFLIIYGRKG